jgi:diacylglycerol O-acyltransferase
LCIRDRGLYRAWLRRQRRMHTLLSNVPGPPAPISVGGAPVTGMVPIAVGDSGNLTVTFACLSYAGTLTVTAVADPERVPDLPRLTAALQSALDELGPSGPGTPDFRPRPVGTRRS